MRKRTIREQEGPWDGQGTGSNGGVAGSSGRPSTPVRSNLLTKRDVLLSAQKKSVNGEVQTQEGMDYARLDEIGKNR